MDSFKKFLSNQDDEGKESLKFGSTTKYSTFRNDVEEAPSVVIQLSDRAKDGSFKQSKKEKEYQTYNTNFNYPLLDVSLNKVI